MNPTKIIQHLSQNIRSGLLQNHHTKLTLETIPDPIGAWLKKKFISQCDNNNIWMFVWYVCTRELSIVKKLI